MLVNGYQDEKGKESNKLTTSKEEEDQDIDNDNIQDTSLQQEKRRYSHINFYEYV